MYQLVADIGGTNSRFALCKQGSVELEEPRKYPNKEHATLANVIARYVEDVGNVALASACLAVAGPAHGDAIQLTNIDWQFLITNNASIWNGCC
jgi:glucokinase